MSIKLSATLVLNDKLSPGMRAVMKSVKQTDAATAAYASTVDRTTGAMDKQAKKADAINKASKKMTETFYGVAGAAAKMAVAGGVAAVAAGGIFAGSAIKKAMDFEHQLASIEALTGLNADEMARMEKLALDAGAATKYSALEAAQGMEELLKAGLSPAQVEADGLMSALNLATAGGLDLAEAAEIMSTAMNAFSKDGMTAAHAADVLAGTANASATDVHDLRYSLAMASAMAAGVGMSFDDTNKALGIFANKGLKGSDAGTSLKTMLMHLQPQSKEQVKLFDQLGLTVNGAGNAFFDAKGKLKSLEDIAGVLNKTLGKMTDQQRMKTLEDIFGSDAIRGGAILFEAGAKGVRDFSEEMSNVTALHVAETKMKSAAGAVELFKGAWETLQISVGKPTLPIIRSAMLSLTDVVDKYSPKIVAGVENAINGAKNYVKTNFIDNQAFRDLPTIQAKVAFAIDKLTETFNKWYESDGRKQLFDASERIVKEMATFFENNSKPIIDVASSLGKSIGEGISNGLWETLKDHPILGGMAAGAATPGPVPVKAVAAGAVLGAGNLGKSFDNYAKLFTTGELTGSSKSINLKNILRGGPVIFDTPKPDGSHSGGLSNVPFNGYVARLHKGERVLTAEENRSQSRGGGSVSIQGGMHVHISGSGYTEKDADELIGIIYRRLSEAAEGGA